MKIIIFFILAMAEAWSVTASDDLWIDANIGVIGGNTFVKAERGWLYVDQLADAGVEYKHGFNNGFLFSVRAGAILSVTDYDSYFQIQGSKLSAKIWMSDKVRIDYDVVLLAYRTNRFGDPAFVDVGPAHRLAVNIKIPVWSRP
jgi:hypothetical protein